MSISAERSTALLVFARAPIPGAAKTRLIPLLGSVGAARLHERLVTQALATATRAKIGPVQLWCTPDGAHPYFAACVERYPISLHKQCGSSLGERLAHSAEALTQYARVLFIGTDCPVLLPEHLRTAAQDLVTSDAVIFPAEDGGYVLLGLAKPCPGVFVDIDWGSERVFTQTMRKFASAGMRVVVRDTLWDVDLPADYRRLVRMSPWLERDL